MSTKQQCKYSRHYCTREQYRNYRYCFQHILEDKTAPFMPCQHISKTTRRRCHNPALKNPHAALVLCEHHQQTAGNSLYKLKTFKKAPYQYGSRDALPEEEEFSTKKKLFGIQDYDKFEATSASRYEFDASLNSCWSTARSQSWKYGEADIDADSCDDSDDPLKNAGVHTLEEVASLSKQRLTRLKSLYIKQFGHLNRQLQAKRRQFLLSEAENPSKLPRGDKSSKSVDERKFVLKSHLNYRRHRWSSSVLHRKSKGKRIESSSGHSLHAESPSNKTKCCRISNHVRCKNVCLPYTKYCHSHILEDPLQLLYKKCSFADCPAPVCTLQSHASTRDDERPFCPLHLPLPPVSSNLVLMMEKMKGELKASSEVAISEKEKEDSSAMECDSFDRKMAPNSTSSNDNKIEETRDREPEYQHLSPADIDQFKTGQCFVMNRITMYDETGDACKPAIHLEPIPSSPVDSLGKSAGLAVSSTQTAALESTEEDSGRTSVAGSVKSEVSMSACVRHNDAIMTVKRDDDEPGAATKARRVTTSATVVPPVGAENGEHEEDESDRGSTPPPTAIDRQVDLLRKMPPLAPIDFNRKAVSPTRDSVLASTFGDNNAIRTHLDQSSPPNADSQISCERGSRSDTEAEEHKDQEKNDEGGSHDNTARPSVTSPSDSSDSSSNEASRTVKGGDVDVDASNERKPSSADEETAIASLLFLSSGTLQKH